MSFRSCPTATSPCRNPTVSGRSPSASRSAGTSRPAPATRYPTLSGRSLRAVNYLQAKAELYGSQSHRQRQVPSSGIVLGDCKFFSARLQSRLHSRPCSVFKSFRTQARRRSISLASKWHSKTEYRTRSWKSFNACARRVRRRSQGTSCTTIVGGGRQILGCYPPF